MESELSSGKIVLKFLGVASVAALLVLGFRFVRASNLLSSLEEVERSCWSLETAAGPEDLVIDRERGFAYVSATDRRALQRGGEESARLEGGLYRIDLKEAPENWHLLPLAVEGVVSLRPHGVGLYIGTDGRRSLFVVNHPAKGPDEVVIFDLDMQGELRHRRTVRDPLLSDLNDVQPVGHDSFYATNDHGATPSPSVQDFLVLDRASLIYFDGSRAVIAAAGLSYANGVNVSSDGLEIFVAETLDRRVRVYRRDVASGDLTLTEMLDVGTGVDNIDVLENGDLLVGAHPKILDFAAHAEDAARLSPSQVVQLSRSEGTSSETRTVYLNRGEEISGLAVAAGYGDWMLMGPVFQPKILVCKREIEPSNPG